MLSYYEIIMYSVIGLIMEILRFYTNWNHLETI